MTFNLYRSHRKLRSPVSIPSIISNLTRPSSTPPRNTISGRWFMWMTAVSTPSWMVSAASSIERFIEEHLAETPALPLICDHFSFSRTYLCRVFKEETGTSPIDYWINLKIKEAKKLIREGNHNITQISELLGYTSIHHFTRMFKRVTGLSPTAYKSSVKM